MKVCRFFVFLFFVVIIQLNASNPVKEYIDHPGDFDFDYLEENVVTEDGFTLKSWVCLPDENNANNTVLVLAYGNYGNMSFWLRQTAELVRKGFTVVLFDYRGFGASDPFVIEANQLYYDEFIVDLKAVIEHTSKKFKSKKIGVWALSMGTIYATMVNETTNFDFMIAEGFVANPQDIVEKIKKHNNENFSLPPKAYLFEKALSNLVLPILFFSGDKDGLTTIEESYRIKFLNPKSDIIIFKGGHLQGFQSLSGSFHGEKYIMSIEKFLKELN